MMINLKENHWQTWILIISTILLSLNSCRLFPSQELNFSSKDGVKFLDYNSSKLAVLSKKEQKPLFLLAYANYCSSCKKMEKTVFPEPTVGSIFNQYFITAKVNIDSEIGKRLVSEYNIIHTPTLLFFDSNGKLMKGVEGFQDKEDLILLANNLFK